MWDELFAMQAEISQLQAQIKPLLPPPPPPPVPIEDPELAKLQYEQAQAEVRNQEERAFNNIKAARDNEERAKAILDASLAAAEA